MIKKLLLSSLIFMGGFSIAQQNALSFDGTNDYVQTNFPGILASADRTFEAWIYVNPNAPSSNLAIMDYGQNLVGSRNTFLVAGDRSLRYLSGGTNANINSPANRVPVGQWTHVAFVLNSGTGYLYVDGSQVGTGPLSTVNTPSGQQDLRIGERVSGGSIEFSGIIDEVRIWNVARSNAQIVARMNTEFCTYPSAMVAYYKFNQGAASGNNTGITTVYGELGSTGTANNFSMTGASSNWVSGSTGLTTTTLNLGVTVDNVAMTLTSNDTSTNVSYQWYDCTRARNVAGDTARVFTPTANGNYAVILTQNSCTDTSACIPFTTVGIDGLGLKDQLYISQNPVENTFSLINHSGKSLSLSIRSVTGRLIELKQNVSRQRIDFNLENQAAGLYLLTVETQDGLNASFKVIKQ